MSAITTREHIRDCQLFLITPQIRVCVFLEYGDALGSVGAASGVYCLDTIEKTRGIKFQNKNKSTENFGKFVAN